MISKCAQVCAQITCNGFADTLSRTRVSVLQELRA